MEGPKEWCVPVVEDPPAGVTNGRLTDEKIVSVTETQIVVPFGNHACN